MMMHRENVERLASIERTGEVTHTAHTTIVFARRLVEFDPVPKMDTEGNAAEVLDRSHLKHRVSIKSYIR